MSMAPPPVSPPPPPPAADAVAATSVQEHAGFGARLGSAIIDLLVIGVPMGVLFFILTAVLPKEPETLCVLNDEIYACEPLTGAGKGILMLVMLAAVGAVLYFYTGKLQGLKGQTIGQKSLDIELVGKETGQPIGIGGAVGRTVAKIVSAIPFYLGYLWMLWDKDNQTWHDKMTDSVVVKK